MIRLISTLLILVALLAGCASSSDSNPLPTIAPLPPSAETVEGMEQAETTETPVVIFDTLPPAGTAVLVPVTEDPSAGLPFDLVRLDQTGGITGVPLSVEVYQDGRVIRDGVQTTAAPEQVQAIDAIINEIDFFGLRGQFRVPGTQPDVYYYKIYVERAGASRTIDAQDGYTPELLLKLINAVSLLGAPGAS